MALLAARTRTIEKAGRAFVVADRGEHRRYWDWYESETWEPETIAVFTRFLHPNARYADLGSWIGSTVLLAAATALRVVSVEPDPLAFAALTENLALNPAVSAKTVTLRAAAGAEDGAVVLTSAGAGGDSNSSVARQGDSGARWTVEQVSFRTLLGRAGLDAVDFVKMDIEGAEYQLVPEMLRDARPTLYVALHPNLLVDKRTSRSRFSTSLRALRANRRFLRATLVYAHHYVWDERRSAFRDVRARNRVRIALPLPLRSSFLIGACVFTDEDV